jgi:hypothetical protein
VRTITVRSGSENLHPDCPVKLSYGEWIEITEYEGKISTVFCYNDHYSSGVRVDSAGLRKIENWAKKEMAKLEVEEAGKK